MAKHMMLVKFQENRSMMGDRIFGLQTLKSIKMLLRILSIIDNRQRNTTLEEVILFIMFYRMLNVCISRHHLFVHYTNIL
jgi:hypothetical protein